MNHHALGFIANLHYLDADPSNVTSTLHNNYKVTGIIPVKVFL